MFFGGNKNITNKIIIVFAIVFFAFGFNTGLVGAQESSLSEQISELQSKIRECEKPNMYGQYSYNKNSTVCTEDEYEAMKAQLKSLENQNEVQENTGKIVEQEEIVRGNMSQLERYTRAKNECFSNRTFQNNSTFCSAYSSYSYSGIESKIKELERQIKKAADKASDLKKQNEKIGDTSCNLFTNPGGCIEKWFTDGITWISNMVIQVVGLMLRLAGMTLDQTVSITIENMGYHLDKSGDSIKNAWSIIRDMINMIFIFGLLFIALSTIIKGIGSKTKNLLITIIASALLINFSYLFTTVAIDASNFLSIEILNSIKECGLEKGTGAVGDLLNNFDGGISSCVMNEISIQSAFNPEAKEGFANQINPTGDLSSNIWKIFISTIFGAVFIVITSFVFFALAIMLVIRFVLLIMLLITSPVMFLGWVLPNLSGVSKKWFESLNEQLLFPPLVFLFIYITIEIAKTTNLIGTTKMGIVINYLIIMSFMVGSILIAKKVGGIGGGVATNLAGKASIGFASRGAGSLGRRTIGRSAAAISDKIAGTTRTSQFLKKKIDGVANRSFDARNTKSFQGIASATGLTGATGTPTTKGFRGRQEEKADLEKERYDNAKKQTESEARKIERNLKHIQDSEFQRKEDGVGENRLKVIEDSKKEITEDRQNLANINNQIKAAQGTPEEKELQIKAKAINKKITQTQETIDKSEKELNEAYEGEFQAIKKVEKKAKDRAEAVAKQVKGRTEGVLGKVSAIFGSSDNLASRKIADSSRKKDDENGTLLTMTKDYKKPEDRKGRYDEQEKQIREEEKEKAKKEAQKEAVRKWRENRDNDSGGRKIYTGKGDETYNG